MNPETPKHDLDAAMEHYIGMSLSTEEATAALATIYRETPAIGRQLSLMRTSAEQTRYHAQEIRRLLGG